METPSQDKPQDKPQDKQIKERPPSRIPANECTPERLKQCYREQADWYEWAVDYSLSEAEKIRRELDKLLELVVAKELEIAELEADARSFGDILETYRELACDDKPDPTQQQEDCFD